MADDMAERQESSSRDEYLPLGEFSKICSTTDEVRDALIDMKSVDKNIQVQDTELLRKYKETWKDKDKNHFSLFSLLNKRYSSEDVEKFLHYMIKETVGDKTEKCIKFWYTIFAKNAHWEFLPQKKPFIGLLVESGNFNVLLMHLNHSLLPNLRQSGPNAETPLHYLCQIHCPENNNDYIECINWLLARNEVDVNALNCNFKTPFNLAVEVGNTVAQQMLNDSGKQFEGRQHVLQALFSNRKWSEEIESLGKFSILEVSSCLKIMMKTRDPHRNHEDIVYAMILHMEKEQEALNVLLQEASREDFQRLVQNLCRLRADPCAKDKWNYNLSAIDIAEKMRSINCLPGLWEKNPGHRPKSDASIFLKKDLRTDNTILHIASIDGCPNAMCRILESSGLKLICAKNYCQEVPFIPDEVLNTDVVGKFLDSQICKSDFEPILRKDRKWLLVQDHRYLRSSSTYNKCMAQQIYLNLGFLIDFNKDEDDRFEMANLMEMSKNKMYHQYLIHPVMKIFLLYRWKSLQWIFFLNLIFSVLLTLCLTFNIAWTTITNSDLLIGTHVLQGLLIFFLILREVMQWKVQKIEYFYPSQHENYIEMLIIILGGGLTIAGYHNKACEHIGAFVILLVWVQLMLLIGKHPKFSVQVEMFLLVLKTFLKFLFLYSFMIIGFGWSFSMIFKPSSNDENNSTKFSNFGDSIFRTFIMTGGEFDASNIQFENYPGTSHIIFILFFLTVAIVLLNLLNGLAVHDTQLIKKDASLYTYLAHLKYLTLLDKFSTYVQNYLNHLKFEKLSKDQDQGKHLDDLFYVLSDDYDDIWKELYEIIYKQQKETRNENENPQTTEVPKVGKMICEDLSKQIDALQKKQLQDSEAIQKLTSMVENLSKK